VKPLRSTALEGAAAHAAAAARAAGLRPRQAAALAREELRVLERVGGGERYRSLRTFLEALCSRTG
jgi:hypothetical protein